MFVGGDLTIPYLRRAVVAHLTVAAALVWPFLTCMISQDVCIFKGFLELSLKTPASQIEKDA